MNSVLHKEDWPSIPGYTLQKVIGNGGFGIIFLAEENSLLKRRCAVKVCWPSPFQSTEGVSERFYRECKTLSELNHPNVVSYVNSGFTEAPERKPFMVMGFVDGSNLQKEIASHTTDHACTIVLSLLDTLEHCHSNSVIHRDIKPSNIIIRTVDRVPVLVDFGLSINLAAIGERVSKDAPGSPGYMAPELMADPLTLDVRLDVYSMGVVLYELLAGKLPDPSNPRPLADFRSELDPDIDDIIRCCLAPTDSRYPSISKMKERLHSWLIVHRERVAQAGKLSARGRALRSALIEERRRRSKSLQSPDKFAAEMVRLAQKQASLLITQTVLSFEEVLSSLQSEVPGISLSKDKALHSPDISPLEEELLSGEPVDLVTLTIPGYKLIFAAMQFTATRHPWTGEPLFTANTFPEGVLLDLRREGPLSPRAMQPLFILYSQNSNAPEERWMHLAIALVFDEAEFVDLSTLRFVAEHHPKFIKMDNLLIVGASPDILQDEIWRVIEWFTQTHIVNLDENA